jgi:hypothetical protein
LNRKEAFEYIEVATHERIKERCKYVLRNDFKDIDEVKNDIEYYEQVMKYIEENLK